jgi:hypothetical protein
VLAADLVERLTQLYQAFADMPVDSQATENAPEPVAFAA